jgi:thiol-disulfide isomerase/thioredoxin
MKKLIAVIVFTNLIFTNIIAQVQPAAAAAQTEAELMEAKPIQVSDELDERSIHFENEKSEWKAILQRARDEKKLIFLDAYASWCGPCKWMEKNVFPNAEVAEVYNKYFVSARIDMEKGEGKELAKRYNVRMYPTYIFVNGEGEQVHRALGSMEAAKFIELGNIANDPDRQFATLKKRYLGGEKEPAFLKNFASMCDAAQELELLPDVVDAYLATQKEWNTKVNMEFIKTFTKSIDKPAFAFILKNQADFEKNYSKKEIETFIYQTALKNVATVAYDKEKKATNFELVNMYGNKYLPKPMTERIASQLRISQYKRVNDTIGYLKQTVKHFDKYPTTNATELNQYAWDFYEKAKDKSQLKKALAWSLASIKIDDVYGYNDTAAALYFKLKDKKNAMLYATKAIQQAQKSGDDAAETEALLLKINKI